MDHESPGPPPSDENTPGQKPFTSGLILGLHLLLPLLLVILALLHWGLKAVFAREERQRFVEEIIPATEGDQTIQWMSTVVGEVLRGYAYPTESAAVVTTLARGTRVRIAPLDERAPADWIQILLPEGGSAWARKSGIGVPEERVVTLPGRPERRQPKPIIDRAIHFGKPSFPGLLRHLYPGWITAIAAILVLLALVGLRLEGISWKRCLAATASLTCLAHLTIQTINFLVISAWGR